MRIVTNLYVLLGLLFIIFVVSIYFAIETCDATYFSGAGAMMTLSGIILTTRSLLVDGFKKVSIFDKTPFADDPKKDEIHAQNKRDSDETARAERWGFYLLCIGTFIWAYGDKLFKWLVF